MKHEKYWIVTINKENGVSKTVKALSEAEVTNIFYRVLHGDVEFLSIKKVIETKGLKKPERKEDEDFYKKMETYSNLWKGND